MKRSEDDVLHIVDEPYLSADGMLGYDNDINPNDKTSSWPIGSQSTDDIWLEVKGCGSAKALCVQIQPLRHLNKNDKHCQRHNGPMGRHHNWRHLIASKFSKQMALHAYVGNSATKWHHLH